jgi:hypothetical protein
MTRYYSANPIGSKGGMLVIPVPPPEDAAAQKIKMAPYVNLLNDDVVNEVGLCICKS